MSKLLIPETAAEIGELAAAVRSGMAPRQVVRLATGRDPGRDPVRWTMQTGALTAELRPLSATGAGAASSDATGLDHVAMLRGTTSSNSKDLHRSRMKPRALETMRRTILSDMTFFLNHSYVVPEDVLGTGAEAEFAKRKDAGENVIYTDLDVGVRVVPEDTNPRAMQAFRQVRARVKHGFSIGAYILEYSWEEEDTFTPVQLSEDEEFCTSLFGPPPGILMAVEEVMLLESSCVGMPSNRRSWTRQVVWDYQIFEAMRARAQMQAEDTQRTLPKRAPWAGGKTYSFAARAAAPATVGDQEGTADGSTAEAASPAQHAGSDPGSLGQSAAGAPDRAGRGRGQSAPARAEHAAAPAHAEHAGDHAPVAGGSGDGGMGAGLVTLDRSLSIDDLEREAMAALGVSYDAGRGDPSPPQNDRPLTDEEAEQVAATMSAMHRQTTMGLRYGVNDQPITREEAEEWNHNLAAMQRGAAVDRTFAEEFARRYGDGGGDEDAGGTDPTLEQDEDDAGVWGPPSASEEYDIAEEMDARATERDKEAQAARATRYGISSKRGGNITKPADWDDVPESQWGDPVNYRYPMPDATHADNAASRWDSPGNRRQYSTKEQGTIGGRIERRQARFGEGHEADGQPDEERATPPLTERRGSRAQHPVTGQHSHSHFHGNSAHTHRHGHDGDGDHMGHDHTQEETAALEQAAEGGKEGDADADDRAPAPARQRRLEGAEYRTLRVWAERRVANCRGEALAASQVDDLLALHDLLTHFLASRGLIEGGITEGTADAAPGSTTQAAPRRRWLAELAAGDLEGGTEEGEDDEDADEGTAEQEPDDSAEVARGVGAARMELRALRAEIAAAGYLQARLTRELRGKVEQLRALREDLDTYEEAVREAEEIGLGRPLLGTGTRGQSGALARIQSMPRDELLALPPHEAVRGLQGGRRGARDE